MTNSILKNIETIFEVELDDSKDAQIIYNSLKPEVEFSHNDRSTSSINVIDNRIVITIYSKDTVSLRASINSYIRWINLSMEILKI
ncbi:MAG: hypothetical protein LUG89_04500 [Methanosphaera sp.]|nr:hypothetical protein [Methanosphaera sp.]